jgi:hypothetical protein
MKNEMKSFVILILMLLLGITATMLFLNYREKESLSEELYLNKKANDSIQKKLLKRNQEVIELLQDLQSKTTTAKGSTSKNQVVDGILLGKKPISIEQLIEIANKYQDENILLKVKAQNDSLTIRRLNRIINLLDKEMVITKGKDGEISYHPKIDSLYKLKVSELQAKDMLLGLIKKNYDIDTKIEYENDKIKVKIINTERLDSALLLLPYYKHKIKNNRKGETIIK